MRSFLKLPVSIVQKYNNSLIVSPWKTKMATTGFTYLLADGICQKYIEKKDLSDYSPVRSLRQGSVGAFFAAPSLHVWHSIVLPKLVKFCTRNVTRVLVSVFLNETVFATYFISCLLFSFETLRTMDMQAGAQNVQDKFGSSFKASMKFWTGISFMNYGLIPVHLRPVFVSFWSIIWQSYLSYVSNNNLMDIVSEKDLNDAEMLRPAGF